MRRVRGSYSMIETGDGSEPRSSENRRVAGPHSIIETGDASEPISSENLEGR